MLSNNGNTEGLFRAGFMQSGAALAAGDITSGQNVFDIFVQNAGCAGSKDVLDCLRNISAEDFQTAADASPTISSFRVSWTCGRSTSSLTDRDFVRL